MLYCCLSVGLKVFEALADVVTRQILWSVHVHTSTCFSIIVRFLTFPRDGQSRVPAEPSLLSNTILSSSPSLRSNYTNENSNLVLKFPPKDNRTFSITKVHEGHPRHFQGSCAHSSMLSDPGPSLSMLGLCQVTLNRGKHRIVVYFITSVQ